MSLVSDPDGSRDDGEPGGPRGDAAPDGPRAGALPPLHRLEFAAAARPRPVSRPDGGTAWLVTRYKDVRQVLTDPRFSRAQLYTEDAPRTSGTPNVADTPESMFNQDGPDHLRLRRTVQQAFTPRAVGRWRPWVASVVERLLDDLVDTGAPADLVASFTRPLPFAVISTLMGLEGLEPARLRHWASYAFADGSDSRKDAAEARAQFGRFAARLLAERRREPGDDLVSRLVRAADQEGGIPEEQLVQLVCGLAAGGNDSATAAIGNAVVYLLSERRTSWPRLACTERARVATERLIHRIPLGDEESGTRRAVSDVRVGGVTIPAGSVVAVSFGSANRDPEVFPPEHPGDLFAPLDAPTMAFGAGPHHCLGSWLIRMEMHLSLERLATRLPGLRLAEPVGAIEWHRTTTRSPQRLRVLW
ncbi:cytochrome P450 [Streptomyces sulfonofaciens]|uniref:Cytochrome P450 n=1 Tax=Streptomyces sulfonofaciens TaxID=68272 RepID=A0A919GI67_9ACTN|nr:cytochrome P450 [Streptomyces sulfonofaciens]GHH84554.1 cytochrome P450 [Streptomyces sulfonofaciens]